MSEKIGKDKPLIIRTLDIGADKSLPYFKMAPEQNPSLGERGIRFTLDKKTILKTQLRAILRGKQRKKYKNNAPYGYEYKRKRKCSCPYRNS